MLRLKTLARLLVVATIAALGAEAQASLGLTELFGKDGTDPVTLYYPSDSESQPWNRGAFTFQVAWQGVPKRGNGRLVVISHGSGGSPWVHADLARALVDAGFVVAFPEHVGDSNAHGGSPGPESWKRRPADVSRAIDTVERDPRFARFLVLDKVGMYGVSAGGHTALSLAGGRWSPARLKAHCEAHLVEDFHACVGLSTRLTGGFLDGPKKWIALTLIRRRLNDDAWYSHTDPRITAIVAGVPVAVDFDMASLAKPNVPLALITAQQDRWLVPRFHSGLVLQACASCELLADFPNGGHGALLSPLPPGLSGVIGELLNDPPGFDREALPELDRKIVAFFRKRLLP